MLRYTKLAEETGYDSVWVAEDLSYRDAVAPLASLAMSTRRIKLGTGILPVYYRSPALAAMTVATLDELSEGRTILGLGNGVRSYVERQGIEFKKPLTALREYIHIIRLLLSGEKVTYEGHVHSLKDTKLEFKPIRRNIPIYIAARSAKMFQLAGEIGDGVLGSDGFCADDYVGWASENMRMGADRAGRSPEDVDFASLVLVSVSEDHDKAKKNIKPSVLSLFAEGTFDRHLPRMGLSNGDLSPVREALIQSNFQEACERIPDALLDASAIYGTPEECAIRMSRLRAAGVRLPIVEPVGPDKESIVKLAKHW